MAMGDGQAGRRILTEMLGEDEVAARDRLIDAGGFGAAATELALDYCFGGVWARTGLDRKQRSLVTLGILIALRLPDQLRNHVRIALNHGITVEEIEEVLLHATAYVGFAAAGAASSVAETTLRDLGRIP